MSQRYIQKLEKVEHALGFKHKLPQLKDIDEYLKVINNYNSG